MANEVVTLTGITIFFKDDLNMLTNGKSEFKTGLVLELNIVGFLIKAQVRASMKGIAYRTSLTVDGDGGIREAECECHRGKRYVATWQLLQYMATSMAFQRPINQLHG